MTMISIFYVVLIFACFVLVGSEKVTLCFLFETWLDTNFLFGLAVSMLVIISLFELVYCSLLVVNPGLACLFDLE